MIVKRGLRPVDLDRALLPLLAHVLRRLLDAGRGGRLSRLDDPLPPRLIRVLPGAGTIVLVALLLAGSVGAVAVGRPAARTEPAHSYLVGPAAGQHLTDYLVEARDRLDRRAAADVGGTPYALVDLRMALTAAQLVQVLSGTDVERVYVRSDTGGAPRPIDVRVLPGDVADQDVACSCLVAAVVRARLPVLVDLAGQPEVLVVDPAPAGVPPDRLRFVPLAGATAH